VLWKTLVISKVTYQSKIGIPVAVQGRKNNISCLSGQAPQSLARHCKKNKAKLILNKLNKRTPIISYAKSIRAKCTKNNIDNLI